MSLWPRESIETRTFWDRATAKAVEEQLADGADKDTRNKNGETPLHFAAMVGKLDAFHCLIKAGPNINPRSLNGTTPLHHAVSRGELEIIETLLQEGADIEASVDDGTRPLHTACLVENGSEIIRLFSEFAEQTEQGLNLYASDNQGRTPLHIAALVGREETITTLLDLGADGRDQDSNQLIPFDRFSHAHKSLRGSKIYWLLNDARYSNKIMRQE